MHVLLLLRCGLPLVVHLGHVHSGLSGIVTSFGEGQNGGSRMQKNVSEDISSGFFEIQWFSLFTLSDARGFLMSLLICVT